MFCIYKTDPDWIQTVKTLPPDVQVNFWRKGKNDLKLTLGSWLHFNQRRTKLIVGRGVLVDYTILTIENAWARYGIGNGVSSLAELTNRARIVLGIEEENTEIGCIVLSELEFLTVETNYTVTEQEYSKNIVGPKYLQDHEIPDLHNRFQPGSKSERTYSLEEEPPKLYAEGESSYSYRKGFERNTEARRKCLSHHGHKCGACGTLLEDIYGPAAREFIHVHHISMISESEGSRLIDPVKDLIPLCPNCHSVAHRKMPPYTITEIQEMMRHKAR